MLVIGLALIAGVSFGALPTGVRYGLGRTSDAAAGAAAQNTIGLALCSVLMLALGSRSGDFLRFLLVGFLVPGLSAPLLVRAVHHAGPARASVIINAYPVVSVALALAVLHEPFSALGVTGALLILAGTITFTRERMQRTRARRIGLTFAVATAALFSARDIIVRSIAVDAHVAPEYAATVTLLAASIATGAVLALESPRAAWWGRLGAALPAFAPAGIIVGIAYTAMFQAFFDGHVSIVSPLIGTAAFWGVLIPAVLLRHSETVGRHLLTGGLLVMCGGVLIGIFH